METHTTYRAYLRNYLAEAIAKNPSYSLRAMAKYLDMAPSMLSQVINGKKNLSKEAAHRIALKLKLDEQDLEQFSLLVEMEGTKSLEVKDHLLKKMTALNPQYKSTDLNLEVFKMVSDWYHFAILELTQIDDFKFNVKNVAKKIGISTYEAEIAIQRLLQLELIQKNANGTYTKADNRLLATAEIPNNALRNYHRQMLNKAIESLETQTPQEKIIGSETFAFAQEDLKHAKKLTEEFFSKMVELANRSKKKKKHIYHFALQFFKLTQGESHENK